MFIFEGVNHKYKKIVFKSNLDLNLNEHTKLWIKGKGGSGKSTFLDIIAGHLEPTIGNLIKKKDYSYLNINDGGRGLKPTSTLKEAVFNNLFLRSRVSVKKEFVYEVLNFAELIDDRNKLVNELSHSEKGKLVGALSTSCIADVIIAEKMPSNSDKSFQLKLNAAIERQISMCKFLFLVTKNSRLAKKYCNSMCDLDQKKITVNKI